MLQSTIKIESMLFDYETTYKTDYRHGEIREYPRTVFKPKPVQERASAYRNVNNSHTLTEWKTDAPPFSLTHAPKEIIRTNPYTQAKPFEKKEDVDRESVQKTRPRLVMTPAVSMDDIADSAARAILCTDMYTSETSRGMREAVAASPPRVHVKAPLPGLPAPANPVYLRKLQPPLVSPEWRMQTASWDGRQTRAHCDPTAEYWLRRRPMEPVTCKRFPFFLRNNYLDTVQDKRCRKCEESVIVSANRKMQ